MKKNKFSFIQMLELGKCLIAAISIPKPQMQILNAKLYAQPKQHSHIPNHNILRLISSLVQKYIKKGNCLFI